MKHKFVAALFASAALAGYPSSISADGFVYDDQNKRDPFEQLVDKDGNYKMPSEKASPDDFNLEGIVWDASGESFAIINGEVVKEGQALFGMKLILINKDSVVVDSDGVLSTIELIK